MSFLKTYKEYFIISAIVWAACLVLFAFVFFLVISPQRRSQKVLEKELDEKKQMYEFAQNAAKEETKARSFEEINILREELNNFTIDFRDSASLTFHISQIARENKVNSLNVETKKVLNVIQTDDSDDNILENHLTVSFTARFNEFAGFLNSLERHKPVLFVNEFTLVRSNQDALAYNVSMDVAAFVRKKQVSKVIDKPFREVFDPEI